MKVTKQRQKVKKKSLIIIIVLLIKSIKIKKLSVRILTESERLYVRLTISLNKRRTFKFQQSFFQSSKRSSHQKKDKRRQKKSLWGPSLKRNLMVLMGISYIYIWKEREIDRYVDIIYIHMYIYIYMHMYIYIYAYIYKLKKKDC